MNDIDIPIMENPLKIMSRDNSITIQQILNNLLNSDKNLALKTEIYNPKQLALFLSFGNYFNFLGLNEPAKLIIDFITNYLSYMVSNKRKSRSEVIRALSRVDTQMNRDNTLITNLD